MSEKILVIGAAGRLGCELVGQVRKGEATLGVTRSEIDIVSPQSVASTIDRIRPSVVLNAAALADVDRCESDPELALAVNQDGAANIARACNEPGIYLVHFSTDYVFDGKKTEPYRESDSPAPVSVYGKSKLAGEQAVLDTCSNAAIVRVSWLYGAAGGDFVERLVNQAVAKPGSTLKVVADQVSSPTWTQDIAGQVEAIIDSRMTGIVHAVAEGGVSRCQFAQEVVAAFELSLKIVPGKSVDFPEAAPRPIYSVLDNSRLKEAGLNRMRPYVEALSDFASRKIANDA